MKMLQKKKQFADDQSSPSGVMSSIGPTALEAQPGAVFIVVVAFHAYFGMPRLPLSVRHAYIRLGT